MLAAIAFCLPAFGQELAEFRELKADERIERKIIKDETHIYTLSPKRDEMMHITVEQRGINIIVAIGSGGDRNGHRSLTCEVGKTTAKSITQESRLREQ